MVTINELMWRNENDAANFAIEMGLPEYFQSGKIGEICLDLHNSIARIHFKGGDFVRMAFTEFKNVYSGIDRMEIHFTNRKGYDYHFAIFYNGRVAFVCETYLKVAEHYVHKQIGTFSYC